MRSKWEDFILFFFRLEAYSSTNTIAIQKPIARIDRGRAPKSGYMLESGIGGQSMPSYAPRRALGLNLTNMDQEINSLIKFFFTPYEKSLYIR